MPIISLTGQVQAFLGQGRGHQGIRDSLGNQGRGLADGPGRGAPGSGSGPGHGNPAGLELAPGHPFQARSQPARNGIRIAAEDEVGGPRQAAMRGHLRRDLRPDPGRVAQGYRQNFPHAGAGNQW